MNEEALSADVQERIRAAQREYHRQCRAKNPDKVKARNIRYWLKKAEQMKQEVQADDTGNGASTND